MCNIRPSIANVSVHLPHYTNVLVAVEQRVLVFALHARATYAAVGCLVGLEAGIGQDDDQPLAILVVGSDGHVLLGNELGESWRRQ